MRKTVFLSLLIILIFVLNSCAKETGPEVTGDFRSDVQSIYLDLVQENGEYDPSDPENSQWPYLYSPMILAAWQYRASDTDVSAEFEQVIIDGGDVFWLLGEELINQARSGMSTLDRGSFLALIPDPDIRAATESLMDEDINAHNAFVRAYVDDVTDSYPDAPEMIIDLLAKAYAESPELVEFTDSGEAVSDSTKWRDWLQMALAATGTEGMTELIRWIHEIEGLQDLVPDDDFWLANLTHAYSLRSIQLARSEALEIITDEVSGYREGGWVTEFHKWIYWNLAWSAHSGTGMYPYTMEQGAEIDILLIGALLTGPVGEGEEADVVADVLDVAPSFTMASAIVDILGSGEIVCDRRNLAMSALGSMLYTPVTEWYGYISEAVILRSSVVDLLETTDPECGTGPVLKLYHGMISSFTEDFGAMMDIAITDDEFVRLHDSFMRLLPSLETADERMSALELLLWGFFQPDFMMRNPEMSSLREDLLRIHEDWSQTTTFENSEVDEENFNRTLNAFLDTLGGPSAWENP